MAFHASNAVGPASGVASPQRDAKSSNGSTVKQLIGARGSAETSGGVGYGEDVLGGHVRLEVVDRYGFAVFGWPVGLDGMERAGYEAAAKIQNTCVVTPN